MRIALIAAVKRTTSGELRAELMLGGRRVLEWQADLAQALGCDRIICLCDAPTNTILALQRAVEGAGAEFHAIRGNIQLTSLVRTDDELVMIRDGLVIDRQTALNSVSSGEVSGLGIATLPANDVLAQSYAEDFERIDRDRHWAGLAIMRAGQVQQLADLPPDGDPMSLLLRLGLQGRTQCRDIGAVLEQPQNWLLAVDDEMLAKREATLIDAAVTVPSALSPSKAVAAATVRALAPRGIESGAEVGVAIACAAMLAGVALTGFGYGIVGLALAAVAAFAGNFADALASLRENLWSRKRSGKLDLARVICIECGAALAAVLAYVQFSDAGLTAKIALPILALGLLYLAGKPGKTRLASFWSDRALHLALLAIAATSGHLDAALAVFGLLALADLLLHDMLPSAKSES